MTIENVHFDQINGSTPGVNVANGSNINVRNCKFTEKPSNSAFAITLTAGALSANIQDNDLSGITQVDKINATAVLPISTIHIKQNTGVLVTPANRALRYWEMGQMFVNQGATGAVTYTLPTPFTGLNYSFAVNTAKI